MDKEKFLNSTVKIQTVEILSNSGKTSYGENYFCYDLDELIKECAPGILYTANKTDYRVKNYKVIKDWSPVKVKDLPDVSLLIEGIEKEEQKLKKEEEEERQVNEFITSLTGPYGSAYSFDDSDDQYSYVIIIKDGGKDLSKEKVLEMAYSKCSFVDGEVMERHEDLKDILSNENIDNFQELDTPSNFIIRNAIKNFLAGRGDIYIFREYIH